MKTCCADWEKQIGILNGYISFLSAREGGRDIFAEAGGRQFYYCPWCGIRLLDLLPNIKSEKPTYGIPLPDPPSES